MHLPQRHSPNTATDCHHKTVPPQGYQHYTVEQYLLAVDKGAEANPAHKDSPAWQGFKLQPKA